MASDIVEVEIKPEESVPENLDFLKELEEFAKSRYTDEDEDFVAIKKRGNSTPPIQPAFGNHDRGQHTDNYRDRKGHDRYNGHQRRDWSRDRERDRGRDYGYGHQNNKRSYDRYNNDRY